MPLQAPVFDVDSLSLFPFLFQVGWGAIDKNIIFHRMRETRKLTKMEMIPMIDELTGGKLTTPRATRTVCNADAFSLSMFRYQTACFCVLITIEIVSLRT